MLDPGQESRALLNCTLSWGSGRWEPAHRVRIRAEARVAAQVEEAEEAEAGFRHISDFPLPLPPGVTGSTGADDRVVGSEVSASLSVECPGGLRGRKAPSRTLQVSVELPSKADSHYDVPATDHLLAARTAVATANWVTERQKCGAGPIRTDASPRPAAGPTPTELCAWLDPEELEFARDAWEFSGDGAYNRRAGFCSGHTTGYGGPPGLPVVEVTAESWSGEFARGAYERHTDAGTAPGQREPSPARPDGSVVIRTSAFSRSWRCGRSRSATAVRPTTGSRSPRHSTTGPGTGRRGSSKAPISSGFRPTRAPRSTATSRRRTAGRGGRTAGPPRSWVRWRNGPDEAVGGASRCGSRVRWWCSRAVSSGSAAATTAGRPTGRSRPRATVCCPPTGYGRPGRAPPEVRRRPERGGPRRPHDLAAGDVRHQPGARREHRQGRR